MDLYSLSTAYRRKSNRQKKIENKTSLVVKSPKTLSATQPGLLLMTDKERM